MNEEETKIAKEFKKNEQSIGKELMKANVETRNEMTFVGKCPKCETGELFIRKGKFGEFIACSKYPDCKTTFGLPANSKIKPLRQNCETCGLGKVTIIRARKRPIDICIDPLCPSKLIQNPDKIKEIKDIDSGKVVKMCPTCKKNPLKVRKSIFGAFLGCSNYPKCRYAESIEDKSKAEPTDEEFIPDDE